MDLGNNMFKKNIIYSAVIFIMAALLPQVVCAYWVKGKGLDTIDVYSFAIKGTTLLASTKEGVYKSIDNGLNWKVSKTGLPTSKVQAFAVLDSSFLAGTVGDGIYRSADSGATWKKSDSGLSNVFVSALAVIGNNVFAGTGLGGVSLSTDKGLTWKPMNNGLTNLFVYSFIVDGTKLFALSNIGDVHVSLDSAKHWAVIPTNLPPSDWPGVAVLGNQFFIGTDGDIFRGSNDGRIWTSVYSNLPANQEVSALRVIGNNLLVALDAGGVFLSKDSGDSWVAVNAGVTNVQTEALSVGQGYVFAGTLGAGAWRRPIAEVISGTDKIQNYSKNATPFKVHFSQNSLHYKLLSENNVALNVFDLQGKMVYQLKTKNQKVGIYTWSWTELPLYAGQYVVQLSIADMLFQNIVSVYK